MTTSVLRQQHRSPPLEREHAAVNNVSESDDGYVPFDAMPTNPPQSAAMLDSTQGPFAAHPPPLVPTEWPWPKPGQAAKQVPVEEISPDEPSIEIIGSQSSASAIQAHPRHREPERRRKGRLARTNPTKPGRTLESDGRRMGKNTVHSGQAPSIESSSATLDATSTQIPVSQSHADDAASKIRKEHWQTYKDGIRKKLGDQQWNPKKRVSPDAMEGIRAMHSQYPDHFTTPVLAKQFGISADAVRRILKSKWRPSTEEEDERRQRWDKRGERIWSDLVKQGVHPPKRWRAMGIGSGPRRPAQDKRLQRAIRQGLEADPKSTTAERDAWVSSLAQRLG